MVQQNGETRHKSTNTPSHTSLILQEDRPNAPISAPLAHALIDHLLLIETELAAIRKLIAEELLP